MVCRGCGREVSPYITECPYCGSRLRRRAPRLERRDGELEPLDDRSRSGSRPRIEFPRPGRRRGGTRPGGSGPGPRRARRTRTEPRGFGRPWATIVLVAVSLFGILAVSVLAQVGLPGAGAVPLDLFGGRDPWWWPLPAAFAYANGWQQLATVVPLGLFGWLWERRAGPLVPALVFVVAGVGGVALSRVVQPDAPEVGGAGAATALAVAWIVAELRARRRGEGDGDLVGAWVIAAVAVAASPFALQGTAFVGSGVVAPVAAALGCLVGVPLGLLLHRAGR